MNSDEQYLDAVERGDLATAQRMVDEAARSAGYNSPKVYHGSDAKFTVFDSSRIGDSHGRSEGAGFYFTTDRSTAEGYATETGTLFSVYLKIGKKLDLNAKPFTRDQIKRLLRAITVVEQEYDPDIGWRDGFLSNYVNTYGSLTVDSAISEAVSYFANLDSAVDQLGSIIGSGVRAETVNRAMTRSLGYDTFFSKGFSGKGVGGGDIYVATSPGQIKSADPITYDDEGRVIPLSMRFDDKTNDIRNPAARRTPPQFPYAYAAYLKRHFPDIWRAGGNIRGNDTFRWWTAYRRGDRSPAVMRWWTVTRPAWIARHYRNTRLPGVIAQIKWGTIGTLGVAGMKRVVEDAIRRRYANR